MFQYQKNQSKVQNLSAYNRNDLLQGISDGAGAILLAGEEAAKGLKPLARLVGWSYVGVDPSIMGVGPVPAIENLLKVTKMTLNDIDLIEVRLMKT